MRSGVVGRFRCFLCVTLEQRILGALRAGTRLLQMRFRLLRAETQPTGERDGDEHAFYAQFNKIAVIRHAVLAYENDRAVACGAFKEFVPGTMEVKRMFTRPEARGKRIAALVLAELEQWVAETGNGICVLETGRRQPEAIALYTRCGYRQIPNYGQYEGKYNSVCFEKKLA